MVIEFRKISSQKKDFELSKDLVKFYGSFFKLKKDLVEINGKIEGDLSLVCSRCGNEFDKKIDQDLKLYISNGIVNHHKLNSFDIIETDSFVDFDFILSSELESIRSDLCFCNLCQNTKVVEYEF